MSSPIGCQTLAMIFNPSDSYSTANCIFRWINFRFCENWIHLIFGCILIKPQHHFVRSVVAAHSPAVVVFSSYGSACLKNSYIVCTYKFIFQMYIYIYVCFFLILIGSFIIYIVLFTRISNIIIYMIYKLTSSTHISCQKFKRDHVSEEFPCWFSDSNVPGHQGSKVCHLGRSVLV